MIDVLPRKREELESIVASLPKIPSEGLLEWDLPAREWNRMRKARTMVKESLPKAGGSMSREDGDY